MTAAGRIGELCYLYARGPLKQWANRLRLAVERLTPGGWLHNPVTRVVLVRMTPGLPTALKNYVTASMGASLPLYLAVSWPIGFLGMSVVILLGDSVATGRPLEALLALVLLLPLIWVGYRYRHLFKASTQSLTRFLPSHGVSLPPPLLPHAQRVRSVFADRRMTGG